MHGAALRLLPSIALSSARELSLQEIKNLCKIDLNPLDKQLLIEGAGGEGTTRCTCYAGNGSARTSLRNGSRAKRFQSRTVSNMSVVAAFDDVSNSH